VFCDTLDRLQYFFVSSLNDEMLEERFDSFIRNGENTMFASSEVFPFRTHAGVASPVVNTKMALCVYDRNTLLSLLLITVESFEWYLMFIVSVVMPCGVCACCFRSASSKRRSWP